MLFFWYFLAHFQYLSLFLLLRSDFKTATCPLRHYKDWLLWTGQLLSGVLFCLLSKVIICDEVVFFSFREQSLMC